MASDIRRLLGELGLAEAEILEPEVFPTPPPPIGEGKGLARAAFTLATVFSPAPTVDVHLVPVRPASLEHSAVYVDRVSEAPQLVQVSSDHALEVGAVVPGGVIRITDYVVGIDLELARDVVIKAGSTAGYFAGDATQLLFRPILAATLKTPPLSVQRPPLSQWVAGISQPWLAQSITELIAIDDDWSSAVAAGLIARMADVVTLVVPPNLPASGLSTGATEWARALSSESQHALHELALTEVTILEQDLRELVDAMDVNEGDDSGWLSDLNWLCLRRDDLECVRALLDDSHSTLAESIRELDARALPFVALLALERPIADDRLRHVAADDPDAWWADIAVEELDR